MRILKIILAAGLFSQAAAAQSPVGSMSLIPEFPSAGKSVQIAYNPANTLLKGRKNIKGVIYEFNNYQWQAADLSLRDSSGIWKGQTSLPADCGFFAVKFIADTVSDNNQNKGYCITLRSQANHDKMAAGGYAAWGLLRSPGYGLNIPGYLSDTVKIEDGVTHFWLEKELTSASNNQAKSVLAIPYAMSLFRADIRSKDQQVAGMIKFLTRSDAPETDMLRARQILISVTKQPARADSLSQIIAKRFPDGNIEKLNAFKAYSKESDPAKKTALAELFLDKYPYNSQYSWFDTANGIDYNRAYLTAILNRIEKNNFKSIDKYIKNLPFITTVNVYYKTIDVAHSRQMMADSFLYPYSKLLVEHMEQLKKVRPFEYQLLSPDEWRAEFDDKFSSGVYHPMIFTHINICRKLGYIDEALKYAKMAEAQQQYRQASLNDDYVFLLLKKGMVKEANEALVKSIQKNQASVEMIGLLKQNYVKQKGSEAGFEQYLVSLKSAEPKTAIADSKVLDQPMVDWSMYDLDGKKVTMQSLKGKVVVLDFWATWCVPCKASFPGMKLAVERYKTDPNVAFYFVDTEERTAGFKQNVARYIKENNFPFKVLFDNQAAGSKENGEVFEHLSKKFSVSGIPQKIIIDKNSIVRFITVGYSGSASELSDEISELVEQAKQFN